MKTIWCRVGVELTLSDKEYKEFLDTYKTNPLEAEAMLKKFLADKEKASLDGETYFPEAGCFGRDDTNNPEEELSFLF